MMIFIIWAAITALALGLMAGASIASAGHGLREEDRP